MSPAQEREINAAIYELQKVREHLDNVMYRMQPLPEEEFQKIRRIYDDCVCKAIDSF